MVPGGRLRAIGIEPLRMRNAPERSSRPRSHPALLGELIGVNANTATRWAALTNGNWTAYAAEVAYNYEPSRPPTSGIESWGFWSS